MMNSKIIFTILLGLTLTIHSQQACCQTSDIMAGIAKIDITPPVGLKMAGHSKRTEGAMGIHDPLYVKALVLEVSGQRTAIITCDLISYSNQAVLDAAKEKFNIAHTMICFSHTHSGPVLGDSKEYAALVEKSMIDGIGKALENMFPVKISAGHKSFAQLGYNRITGRGEQQGALWRNPERIPYGPVDPEVGVIKIEDEDGLPRIILMQYACHPVVNLQNLEISADYPGVATKKVEEFFGDNTTCMFVLGGAGDINPLFMSPGREPDGKPQVTDYSQIEKMGGLLADQVIETVMSLSPPDNREASLEIIQDSLKFEGRFIKDKEFNIHITTLLINKEIGIAACPGEFFVEFQHFWKEKANVPHPFFFGYTFSGGKHPGYVYDIRSNAKGGYGIDDVAGRIEVGAGETIMNKHLENLYRLRGMMREEPRK